MTGTVCHLIVGPTEHGVVRCARDVAAAVGGRTVVADTAETLLDRLPAQRQRCHVHFTDRLFGSDAAAAAAQFISLVAHSAGPIGVTLHDVPQPSDGRGFATRVDAYRRVVDAASGVIVSSDHERLLLSEVLGRSPEADVVPLAVPTSTSPPMRSRPRPDVAVLGFVYPGKGHAEVITAMGSMDTDLGFLVVGRASDGHEYLVDELRCDAAAAGIGFAVTGFVADADLDALLRSVAVPIAHHRHISASGSMAAWVGAGRRPLVPRNRYTVEMESRSPGTLWIYDDSAEGLRDALHTAARHPDRTWLAAGVTAHPSIDEVAQMYTTLFETWPR